MAEITKPNMSNLWASGGAVIAPSGAKIQTGWTAEIPPHQWENFVQNRQDNAIAYLFQRGVAEWDSSTEYFNNKSLVMGSNGILYRAVSNNVGVNPTMDSGANWLPLTANATESVAGIVKIATTAQANAMTANDVALTPAKLGGLFGARSVLAGNGLTGGGALDATRTITLGTPATLSGSTTNAVTASSHTHALSAATETVAGVAQIATLDEMTNLNGGNKIVTPEKLKDAFQKHLLGIDQSYQNVLSSRVRNTNYTNTTGRPIFVAVVVPDTNPSTVGAYIQAEVDGVAVAKQILEHKEGEIGGGWVGFIVPPNSVYKVTLTTPNNSTNAITSWTELR